MAPRPAVDRRREVWLTTQLVSALFAHAEDLGDLNDSKSFRRVIVRSIHEVSGDPRGGVETLTNHLLDLRQARHVATLVDDADGRARAVNRSRSARPSAALQCRIGRAVRCCVRW